MAFDPVRYIRTRSKEEWQQFAVTYFARTRTWVQEHGEKAAVLALITGIALVVFYKLVLVVLAVGVIVICLIWNIALPQSEMLAAATPPPAADKNSAEQR